MTQTTPFYTPLSSSTDTEPASLCGTTLVIPAVSIGSVPQLAVDLLVHDPALQLVKVARLDPSFCFPFVGPSDFDNDELTTALEGKVAFSDPILDCIPSSLLKPSLSAKSVFSNGSLTVIQQRSPVYRSLTSQYITALTAWIRESHFTEVLWLTSIDSAFRTDDQLSTPILSLFTHPPTTPLLSRINSTYPPFTSPDHIPGSLLTKHLFHHTAPSNLNIGALLYFAAEGDTRHDAHIVANVLLALLSSNDPVSKHRLGLQELKEPPSWGALFGRPPTCALYA